MGNQTRTEATMFRMLPTAVHCTYRYVQLRHWFPFCRNVTESMNFQWIPRGKQCNALKNTHIFRCVSGPTVYSPL